MQPFGVLDRYIGKTIFTTIMMTLFMLVSLSGIIKFVDQLKKAGQGSYDALGAGLLVNRKNYPDSIRSSFNPSVMLSPSIRTRFIPSSKQSLVTASWKS